jgi:hypothetical protein
MVGLEPELQKELLSVQALAQEEGQESAGGLDYNQRRSDLTI